MYFKLFKFNGVTLDRFIVLQIALTVNGDICNSFTIILYYISYSCIFFLAPLLRSTFKLLPHFLKHK